MSFLSAAAFSLAFMQSASTHAANTNAASLEQARLNACLTKIEVNAEEAYEDALAWSNEGNRAPARYCTALALIELGLKAEGAVRLEDLANADDGGTMSDRALYLAQSGNAWLSAGLPEAAILTLSNAMKLIKNDPDIYKDRAAAYMLAEKWPEAILDLDSALALTPIDVEALQMRGRAQLSNKNYTAAMADIEAAMRADPKNIDVLVLRGQVREAMRLGKVSEVN